MAGHFVAFAPFLMESDPGASALHVDVFDAHLAGCGAYAGESESHESDERAIAQANYSRCVDGIEKFASLVGRQNGRLALFDRMLGAAHRAGRVHRHDLAHYKPVEEHADASKLQLDGGRGDPLQQSLHISGDMDRLHIAQMSDAVGLAPGGEFRSRLPVGFPGVGVPDVDCKEFKNTPSGADIRREQGRKSGTAAFALDSGRD